MTKYIFIHDQLTVHAFRKYKAWYYSECIDLFKVFPRAAGTEKQAAWVRGNRQGEWGWYGLGNGTGLMEWVRAGE